MADKIRCSWAESSEELRVYHDIQWGVPVHDDHLLFEMLNLEGAQAGLSWQTILKRRAGYIKAFSNFDPKKLIKYDETKVESLMLDQGIIRNRLKITSVISNSRAYLDLLTDFSSLDVYMWSFVKNKKLTRANSALAQQISEDLSKDLKKRGFRFVGSTICYAYMQAVGLINDHNKNCFRYEEVRQLQ